MACALLLIAGIVNSYGASPSFERYCSKLRRAPRPAVARIADGTGRGKPRAVGRIGNSVRSAVATERARARRRPAARRAGTDRRAGRSPRGRVADRIGKFARPKRIIWADDLPKTRSGKIMRRLLRDIADGKALGDVTTLRDPDVMAQLEGKIKEEQAAE